jgi:uncharacterized protein
MLFTVIFKDKLNSTELRKVHLSAHLTWLDLHQSVVRIGGSLRSEPEQIPVGGLWIVEAETKQAIYDLLETDPFWIIGLRESVEIFHWSKAFEDRKSLI